MGPNGAGKTSLLEAVYVLATTRSFRTSRIAECRRHGTESFDLTGRIEGETRVDLGVGWGEEGRRRALNGRDSSLAEHLEVLPVVSWSAADGEVVEGAPAGRRRLLDRGVVSLQPRSLETLSRYRRALDQKRRLLARGEGTLRPWNELLASGGAEIRRLRSGYVERLSGALTAVLAETGLELPAVSLDYRPSPATESGSEDEILEALERAERHERQRRTPLAGPQRDELEIGWAGYEARRVASGGERKLLGMAIAAARGRVLAASGREPIYLLDDLDAELDRQRLEAVWGLFRGCGQALVSSNREEVWQGLESRRRWRVDGGRPRLETDAPGTS